MKGYGQVKEVEYIQSLEKFYSNVASTTGINSSPSSQVSRTFLALHDVKSLVELLVGGDSVSESSEGGSVLSNSTHLLRLLGFARGASNIAELNGEPGPQRAKSTAPAFAVLGSLANKGNDAALSNGAPFSTVAALLFEGSSFWDDYSKVFCKFLAKDRGVAAQPVTTGRKRSNSLSAWEGGVGSSAGGGTKDVSKSVR